MARGAHPGGFRPSLSPVAATLDAYRAWLSGEPDWAAGLDDDGRLLLPLLSPEGADWQLVSHLGWSWADLEACPPRIRMLWLGLLSADREHEASQAESGREESRGDPAETADLLAQARATVEGTSRA